MRMLQRVQMASDDRSLRLRLSFAFWDGKNVAAPLQRRGGGGKQNSACYSATLLLTFLSLPQNGLLVFKSSGLPFLAWVLEAPPGSFTVPVGGLDVVLGGPLHQDSSALTGCRSLNKGFRRLLAFCFQEEQSESVLCVKCVRTEGVFKPAKCLRWEGCLPESESHFAFAPCQLQVSSLNGPDYMPPYGMCLCHF